MRKLIRGAKELAVSARAPAGKHNSSKCKTTWVNSLKLLWVLWLCDVGVAKPPCRKLAVDRQAFMAQQLGAADHLGWYTLCYNTPGTSNRLSESCA